jgi:hypothetical protein
LDPFDQLSLAKSYTWPCGISAEDEPEQCLDFIFSGGSSRLKPVAASVVRYAYKNFKIGEWPTPSDHWPVQAIYELPDVMKIGSS